MWIVTSEYNDYSQHGEYFVAAFDEKPDFHQLKALDLGESDAVIGKLTRGGGRHGIENIWYNLDEFKSGEKA